MSRRNYGYFNPGDVVGAPAEPAMVMPAPAPRRVQARGGLRADMGFMRQVIGGMVGFAGTNTLYGIMEERLGLSPFVARLASGGVLVGAAYGWSWWSGDSPIQKKTTRDAVMVGVGINIALYLVSEFFSTVKTGTGLGAYINNFVTPQIIAEQQAEEVYQ